MEEKYYNYFKVKLEAIPELKQYHSSTDNPAFDKWWGSILATCERMGDKYKRRASKIRFYPQILTSGDDSTWIRKAYQSGLLQAEALLENLMEELQTWGLDTPSIDSTPSGDAMKDGRPFNLFFTISQQQAQQITQTINLDNYDELTKQHVNELFIELSKPSKDKGKIASTVKWLADKSVDALIAILLAKMNLT